MRIGFGFDVHQLQSGQPLWLGGVPLESDKGAVGHSDADVLLHAICDALLGAANLRDIGHHFPNTDESYRGIDSKKLLAEVMALLDKKNYKVVNIDATVCLEKPKINPHITRMQEVLAPILEISTDDISIKATTNESLGFIGREEGVAAYAIVLIQKRVY
ncbi:MAG: 2-C-methyl-D-erythritol 2,4-cyclodiphosphate synthase [Bacteroidetes bacterium]|nr:2-C-methyl-D-erythritol 2,4-cyclodiphosphate synthase [Bacteroidota bacterium]